METLGLVIELVLYVFLILLLSRFAVDWIQMFARSWVPHGPLLVVLEGVYTATDPPVKAVRRILPPLRLGGMAIDLSFIVVLLIVYLLRVLNQALLL
ncbi:MAG TPA: YggT family protein [Marmoricola sp.]